LRFFYYCFSEMYEAFLKLAWRPPYPLCELQNLSLDSTFFLGCALQNPLLFLLLAVVVWLKVLRTIVPFFARRCRRIPDAFLLKTAKGKCEVRIETGGIRTTNSRLLNPAQPTKKKAKSELHAWTTIPNWSFLKKTLFFGFQAHHGKATKEFKFSCNDIQQWEDLLSKVNQTVAQIQKNKKG